MPLSDWFGAISSTLAIIAALYIAFYQERKNRKRINEENRNIGEMICALIKQLNDLSNLLLTECYQASIDQLEKDDVSVPSMKLVPMTGIKKLDQFSPDILYRVFRYYKLTGEDFRNFVLSIDRISSCVEIGMRNYEEFMHHAVKYIHDFQVGNKEFKIMIYSLLSTYEKEKKTNAPIYTGIYEILKTFNASEESQNNGNIRYAKNELIDKIKGKIEGEVKNNKDMIDVLSIIIDLETAYITLQNSNKLYVKSLDKTKAIITKDMAVIMQIHDKLEKQCK